MSDPRSTSRPPSNLRIRLAIAAGIVVIAAAAWAGVTYWERKQHESEVIAYKICVGSDKTKCPSDLGFVRDQGEETLNRWAQLQCSDFKRRRIIVNPGPADCNCTIADVTCSSQ